MISSHRNKARAHAIQAILWDLDGTLIDSEPLHELTLVHSLEIEGIVPPADLHERVVGRSAASIHDHFRREFGLRMAFDEWSNLRCRTYIARAGSLRARQQALDVFLEMREAGIAQAIISNSDRAIVNINLRAIGLCDHVARSLSRNDVVRGKPAPDPYLAGLRLLACDPEATAVIEDSAIGARAGVDAGCRTFFWPEAECPPPQGTILIRNAGELRCALART